MINLQKIADELDFDIDDVEMLVTVFLESANETLPLLKNGIDENNYDEIFKSSHAIKGSASNILLTDIANVAKEMELAAIEKKVVDYAQMFEKLEKLIKEI